MFKWNRTVLLRIFHVVNHLAFAFGIFSYSPMWLLLTIFCWFLYGSLGISIGFHRLLAHRSFQPTRLGLKLTALLGCFATGGSPLAWVGAHRLHHTYPDRNGDPHSLEIDSWWRIYFHLWKPFGIHRKHIRDQLKDPYLKALHRYYFLILILFSGSLYLTSIPLGIFAYSGPAVLAFHAFGLINTFGHFHGYRNFETKDRSTNSWVANLLTWGEGWHNNHHKYPSSYRIGFKSNEIDISAWIIENVPFLKKNQPKHIKTNS